MQQRVRALILFGEAAGLIAEAVLSQPGDYNLTILRCTDLSDAVAAAARVARPGDVVLLAPGGTSFDAYKDFVARGEHFLGPGTRTMTMATTKTPPSAPGSAPRQRASRQARWRSGLGVLPGQYDIWLLLIVAALVGLGLAMVFSASFMQSNRFFDKPTYYLLLGQPAVVGPGHRIDDRDRLD